MRTFASAAVLGMMLAGTALAQSSVLENQDTHQQVAPGGSTVLDGNQSGQQQVLPEVTGEIGARTDAAGSPMPDAASDQQAAADKPAASDQRAASDEPAAADDAAKSSSEESAAASEPASGASDSDSGAASRQSGLEQEGASQAMAGDRDWHGDRTVVRQVQTQLKQEGYDVGAVDGLYGPKTQQALQDFQRDKGHPVTGRIDDQLLASMNIDAGTQTATEPRSDQSGGTQRPITEQSR